MDTFRRLKEFYWPHKRYFFWSLFALLFVTSITVAYPIVLQITIDEVIRKGRMDLVPYLASGFFLLMVIKAFAGYFNQYYGELFGIRSVYSIREALYEKLQFLSFRYYDNARTGDLMSRLTQDVEAFRFFLSFGASQVLNFLLLIGISLSVMFYYSVPLALTTMAFMPFLAIVVYRFDRSVHPAFRHVRKSLAKLNTNIQENVSGINTVKSLSREDFEINKFTTANTDYRERNLFTTDIWARFFPLMELIGQISVVVLLAFGGYLVMNGSMELGQLVAFFSLVWYILGPLMNLGFIINTFSQSKASGERLSQILDQDNEIENPENPVETNDLKGKVVFDNVSLQYTKDDDHAIKNVSFQVEPGSTIGLLGATGSGKTTIPQLLARFYERSEGSITFDDIPIENFALNTLRRNVGFVLQETFLFSSSIKANIAYGNPEAEMDDIIAAAKSAQAHEFIMEMPDGYDTILGERGMGLSGGQKQRIAIARALLINPAVLILDDATSAVDMQTEAKIQKALEHVMEGRTTFIIAHRISSLQHAEEILVMDQGDVVERGTHAELIAKADGAYRRVYDIQYKDRQAVLQTHTG
ncbi:ABC transporter ATP-binding protein [Aureibacillus halotolerans]|uniref:ATP-binding cassette subfamily B protein/subfamily B ATP-binding cassette protein MsbA n=1 Tax=Aureibacillus halotolerans TaxID=1508390 RepID=A0A4R6U7D2_9BACI|nr:ABC transporter ATP-binding protein [Aureibacillus halotolerans]TDQ42251.1 ATP-binding cassette subfamily B protein/subfamily B ATP-binding cassette protein MsbA [Aureibacillus halotolerans]